MKIIITVIAKSLDLDEVVVHYKPLHPIYTVNPVVFEFSVGYSRDEAFLNPIALRKAKIVYSLGPCECNRVKFYR